MTGDRPPPGDPRFWLPGAAASSDTATPGARCWLLLGWLPSTPPQDLLAGRSLRRGPPLMCHPPFGVTPARQPPPVLGGRPPPPPTRPTSSSRVPAFAGDRRPVCHPLIGLLPALPARPLPPLASALFPHCPGSASTSPLPHCLLTGPCMGGGTFLILQSVVSAGHRAAGEAAAAPGVGARRKLRVSSLFRPKDLRFLCLPCPF